VPAAFSQDDKTSLPSKERAPNKLNDRRDDLNKLPMHS
jgi:hypothetical protein